MTLRIGTGYDIHRLVVGRRLILGGVDIRFDRGLLGHSDADVLAHAACDAVLGAAGLGDIGRHFPDDDPAFKNISSIELLRRATALAHAKGYALVNLDATIMAQAPKIAPYHDQMAANLAAALDCPVARVNIKATTTEGLDAVGRGEGIAALCTVLLGR